MNTERPATSPPPRVSFQKRGVENTVFDKRAMGVGLLVCALLFLLAVVWRFAAKTDSLKKAEEFQFSVAEHVVEEFQLRDPVRDIVKERPDNLAEAVLTEEKPNIQITTAPRETPVVQEVIQSRNVEINTPRIEVSATSVDIQDAPLEISMVSDTVTHALQPIAADSAAPADLFKYAEPTPRDRPQLYTMNAAPRPSKSLSALPKAFGEQDAPAVGKLGPANINLFGTGDFFRTMSRTGGVRARTAVDSALHWLAVHQENDGSWDATKFEGTQAGSLADTALSVLAFMGGGHTTRKGEYRRNVLKGLEHLMRHQRADGHIGQAGNNLYTHAICSIALSEAYGRARDERLGAAAQKAVNFCEKAVNADGGWRYTPKSDESDFSVTAWFLQALKTARLAQLKFDSAVFSQGLAYLDSVTDQGASRDSSGAVGYQVSRTAGGAGNGHPALTSAGMMIRQFNGTGVKNHLLIKGAELTQRDPPRWSNKDFYYWYYATYSMHNMGGEYRIWWNQRIRDVLLENQNHEGDHAGSWDPDRDRWGKAGGRVYTTALGALCLEVYYRYSEALNSFGTAPDLDELFFE